MGKKIVTTARGVKLDMDFLRKSQPNATPVVAVKKEKTRASKNNSVKVVAIRKQRLLNAETPAPRPSGQVEPTVEQSFDNKEQTRFRKVKEDKNVSNNSN